MVGARQTHRRTRRPRARLRGLLAGLTAMLLGATMLSGVALAPAQAAAPVGQGFTLNASDLRFILTQIKIAERHAATATPANRCGTLIGTAPDQIPAGPSAVLLPFGLRTVDGSCNNLVPANTSFGTADRAFPRLTTPVFSAAEPSVFGPGPSTSYAQKRGSVFDSQPRLASNLVVDQTAGNPAAVAAAGENPEVTSSGAFVIPNTAPDVGLSAPYNSWFTLFGQFFDHGLDLVGKSGGTVFVPLKVDDPLFDDGADDIPGTVDDGPNFMVLTRAKNLPGPDGVSGDNPSTPVDESADDVKESANKTSPFVDQSQTYTSHPSHQVFLRDYVLEADGPRATGRLLNGPGDGMGRWTDLVAQAATELGIALGDGDALSVPLLATDPYGKFLPGPNGFPQIVTSAGLVEGDPASPVPTSAPPSTAFPEGYRAVSTGHAFLDDIAHTAVPDASKTPDGDADITAPGSPQPAGTYDDEMLDAHFVAGDGRLNENIGLTAVHHVFHAEHNRLAGVIDDMVTNDPAFTQAERDDWRRTDRYSSAYDYGQRLFQAARFVTEMEYQHLAFEEFIRKVQPQVNVFSGYDTSIDPAITAEFAHAVYRFGHSMLDENVARRGPAGQNRDIPLLDAFLNPPSFMAGGLTPEQAAGDVVRGMTDQVGNEIDEFVTEALRNRLLGLPLDLATLNMTRARDTGVAPLNEVRRQLYALSNGNPDLAPYANWNDFGLALRHQNSLVNFVAAYGTHPTITGDLQARRSAAATLVGSTEPDAVAFMEGTGAYADAAGRTTTGLDTVDLWLGGLAEKQQPFGGLLGSTFKYVFETQAEKLQDGDRFYYLSRTAGLNLLVQLEGNSFSELMMRHTDVQGLPADAFSRPDLKFDLAAQNPTGPIVDDPATPYDETTLLIRMADQTIRFTGGEHVVFNGTAGADRVWSSEGDDTLRGNDGPDRLEGGSGNDGMLGGNGDDVLNDLFGDDVLKGGDGDDAMSSGPGFDLNQGGLGSDFVIGGSDPTETFAGPGDDFVFAGDSIDTVFGDDGDDWIEGGAQADLLQGDNGAPFQDDPNTPGHDVIDGDGGNDDYDAEGGDDIMVAGPGIERNEGMLGFDWVTHRGDPVASNADLNFTGLLPPSQDALRDRFDLVEAVSGWTFDDTLRGNDSDSTTLAGDHDLDAAGIARVSGLAALLPPGATGFDAGNIILGGGGSDLMEGRGGGDVIDGDRYLDVRLVVVDEAGAPVQSATSMSQLRSGVFSGAIDPGRIRIVREVLPTTPTVNDLDTAVFSEVRANYDFVPNADHMVVTHARGTQVDGTDTVKNIERLTFADGTVEITNIPNNTPATGTVTINDTTPSEGQALTASVVITDPDGFDAASVVFSWQEETAPGSGSFVPVATGTTYTPTSAQVGLRLRVVTTFTDGDGVQESLTSAATAPVTGTPTAPTIGTATAGAPGSGSATVTWTAPTNDGGSAITGYSVQVLDSADVQVGALRPAGATASSLVVTGLTANSTYRFRVAAVNAVGTGALSEASNPVTPLADTTAPVVSTTTPADLATGVSVAGNVTATFSEPVTGVNATRFTLRVTATNTLVPRGVTYNAATRTAVLNPNADLAPSTQYTARLLSGVVDASGNPLAPVTWTFTTAAPDVPPTVTAQVPAPGATGVSRVANATATFSEPVIGVAGATFELRRVSNNNLIGRAVTYDAATLTATLNPNATLLANTQYRLRLVGGATAIRDLAGQPLTTTAWTFTTGP